MFSGHVLRLLFFFPDITMVQKGTVAAPTLMSSDDVIRCKCHQTRI